MKKLLQSSELNPERLEEKIMIRAEVNKKDKHLILRINKAKSSFFQKANKRDKALAVLI